jgi:polyisoprenyl-phosphate glycosyltransferase
MKNNVYLTTVTPVYHGSKTLCELVKELDKIRNELVETSSPLRLVEAIFIDDGSIDGSINILNELSLQYDWIQVIQLSRNFGQHPATIAGILHARGDWIATLDEDLQHHPKFLIDLLKEAILQQIDVVYAHPEVSVHESVVRDFASRCYKWFIAKLSNNPNVPKFNSFRMMRGNIARAAAAVSGHQTYFDLAVGWFATSIGMITLPLKDTRYILEKKSGYSLRTLLSHARRMLQSSELKVTRIGSVLGLLAVISSTLFAMYIVILKFVSPDYINVQGWSSVMVVVLFLGGLNAFLSGLLIEQQSLILMQSHGKPTFFEIDRTKDSILQKWFQQQKSDK